ncbi:membrane protein [Rubidibacter lacunae KORDI 51-2]|uniref:Membrane protein n=1 Tax=Rubidibacter lacunae KORDI 51-2 TaxID=582515 RepID=U5DJU7_9CHRO|nr:M23 family metallopeptidase [Rubidibacter lacunae]ERN39960.1 membrane protein [Rubidibacter lacunae KORDI 51-2]
MTLRQLACGLLGSLAVVSQPSPIRALEVRIAPEIPQLGSTVSVEILTNTDEPPNVYWQDRSYPAFAVGPNRYRALVPTTPLDTAGRSNLRVTGDGDARNLAVWVSDRSFPVQRITLSGGGTDPTQHELDRVAAFKKIVSPEKFWDGPFLRPSAGRVSTIYGVQRYYNGVFARDYYHRGVDYAAGTGSPVVAPAAGRVALVGTVAEGFRLHGNTVGIDHGQGVISIFLHLNSIDVREGDFIQAGQRLGTIGSTGASTGPHLHWGLYVHGAAVDPVPWRYEGID